LRSVYWHWFNRRVEPLAPSPFGDTRARPLTIRARMLAWLSYLCLTTAATSGLVAIWLPVMWVAVTCASLALVLILGAVTLLLADRRAAARVTRRLT
jgi:hypothetical protein